MWVKMVYWKYWVNMVIESWVGDLEMVGVILEIG